MDKLKMQSMNKIDENILKIGKLFPNCITESKKGNELHKSIDFDILRQELSNVIVEGREERYQFTWPDKKQAILTANAPINKTLRPCKDESVDFDKTENLYIEGDNLEVLKLLQETYLGKIKMIYIDPPYNTGNDFVYNDEFEMSNEEWKNSSGNFDEEGNQLTGKLERNTENNGRFHTDWLNMIYPRLKVARDLLTDDGVIFVSIDDNEQENAKKICSEIFGEDNFIAQVIWERAYSPVNLKKHFSESHDYIICFAKNIDDAVCNGLPKTDEAMNRYKNPDKDPRGVWKAADSTVGPAIPARVYPLTLPSGRIVNPSSGRCWLYSQEKFEELIKDNRVWFGEDGNSTPSIKKFASEVKNTMTPMTIWKYTEVGHSQDASKKLMQLFDGKAYFDYPKSVDLIKRCLQLYTDNDCYVLDFFSGSATTAHAVMQLNAEGGGHRKFILVQLPEITDEKSEANKAGYKNICEIGKERIRRAGKKIKEESPLTTKDLDTGFRVLKLDSSNMQDVYYAPSEYNQNDLFAKTDNVKPDRTPEDLLFQVMLELGATLDCKIEQTTVEGKTIFNVAEGYLVACFDANIDDKVVTAIAKMQPQYAVFRDSSMADDSTATNFEQIFKTYSASTTTKVL